MNTIYQTKAEALATEQRIRNIAQSAYLGIATTTTTPPATGAYWYRVTTAGTYTNFSDIVVTEVDLDIVNGVANNEVVLEVNNGVATKLVRRLKGDKGDVEVLEDLNVYEVLDGFINVPSGGDEVEFEFLKQSGYLYNSGAFEINGTSNYTIGCNIEVPNFSLKLKLKKLGEDRATLLGYKVVRGLLGLPIDLSAGKTVGEYFDIEVKKSDYDFVSFAYLSNDVNVKINKKNPVLNNTKIIDFFNDGINANTDSIKGILENKKNKSLELTFFDFQLSNSGISKTQKIAVKKGDFINAELKIAEGNVIEVFNSSDVLINSISQNSKNIYSLEIVEDGTVQFSNDGKLKMNPFVKITYKGTAIIYDETKTVDHYGTFRKWEIDVKKNDLIEINTMSAFAGGFDIMLSGVLFYYTVPINGKKVFKMNDYARIVVYLFNENYGSNQYYVKVTPENTEPIYVEYNDISSFEKPTNLIRLDFTTNQPLSHEKGIFTKGVMKMSIGNNIIKKDATLEIQGSSSIVYPKKNWEFEFFNNDGSKFPFSIDNSVKLSAWRFKSYWIDATRMRDIVSCRLWRKMEMSRDLFPKREIDFSVPLLGVNSYDTGALGVVDGFPSELYINNEFYGIGCFNLTKNNSNYNLNKNNQNHIQIETGTTQMDFYNMTSEAFNFEYRSPKTPGAGAKQRIEDFKTAAAKTTDFKSQIVSIVDQRNLIDYFIFTQLLFLPDNYGNNIMLTTWGDKFFFLPYDVDNAFGLNWDGTFIHVPNNWAWDVKPDLPENTKLFWHKVRTNFRTEILERYNDLKAKGVISEQTIFEIAKELERIYGVRYKNEFEKWTETPSKTFTSVYQFIDFFKNSKTWFENNI